MTYDFWIISCLYRWGQRFTFIWPCFLTGQTNTAVLFFSDISQHIETGKSNKTQFIYSDHTERPQRRPILFCSTRQISRSQVSLGLSGLRSPMTWSSRIWLSLCSYLPSCLDIVGWIYRVVPGHTRIVNLVICVFGIFSKALTDHTEQWT